MSDSYLKTLMIQINSNHFFVLKSNWISATISFAIEKKLLEKDLRCVCLACAARQHTMAPADISAGPLASQLKRKILETIWNVCLACEVR